MTWDERYRKGDHAHLPPLEFLRTLAARMPAGSRVLDLACGTGRHSLLFAEQSGCKVLGVDSSAVAIELMRARDPGIETMVCAAEEFAFAEEAFDLAIVSMFLDRNLFPKIRACVKPGELAAEFHAPDWVCEHSIETLPHPPARRIAEWIARKSTTAGTRRPGR
jgi:tellurite methyltransferase